MTYLRQGCAARHLEEEEGEGERGRRGERREREGGGGGGKRAGDKREFRGRPRTADEPIVAALLEMLTRLRCSCYDCHSFHSHFLLFCTATTVFFLSLFLLFCHSFSLVSFLLTQIGILFPFPFFLFFPIHFSILPLPSPLPSSSSCSPLPSFSW